MVKARKVGNSVTVTIPKEVVAEAGITEDMDMNVFVREGAVVFEPATSRWERLVASVERQVAERGLTEADVDAEVATVRAERRSSRASTSEE